MKYWREAATVILAARPRAAGGQTRKQTVSGLREQTGAGQECEDYRILMLKRSGKSSFMPSRMVFPGGTLSGVDHSRDWLDLFLRMTGKHLNETLRRIHVEGPRAPMLSGERPEWPPGMSPDVTFRICGIRELFEEAGILLALSREELSQTLNTSSGDRLLSVKQWNESERTELEKWRKLVNSKADAFLEMCVKLELFPNIWELHEWNNWLTPVLGKTQQSTKKPLRFDTMFYICCFECDRLPETSADEQETVLCQWKRPLEFLSSSEDNNLTVDIPQGYELKRLLNFPSLEELSRFSAERESKGLLRCFPVVQLCQDGFVALYPGDCRYPEHPDFDGTGGVLQPLSLSAVQLTDESKPMHRLVFENANMKLLFICNRSLPFGQVAPVEQGINFSHKL